MRIEDVADYAWDARDNASTVRENGTRVGCVIVTTNDELVMGCNVEHPWMSATIHAEGNAIGNMVVNYGSNAKIKIILVVAERYKFTPCGLCCDMIMHFGGVDAIVAYQNERNGKIKQFKMGDLMPEYPC